MSLFLEKRVYRGVFLGILKNIVISKLSTLGDTQMKGNEQLNTKTIMWMLAVVVVFEIIVVKGQNTAPTRVPAYYFCL